MRRIIIMMRNLRILISSLTLGLVVLSGCAPSGDSNDPVSPADPGTKSDFKVALLTPGPVNDSGWSALAYEGLQAIKTETGAEVSNQVAAGNDIREAMRAYAQKKYNVVFGHGFEYNSIGVEVAKDFPDTVFVSSSGAATAKNAGAIRFYLEQGFYLAGVFAAKQSKSGVVGMVGGPDVPSIRSTFKAFKAGAEATNPSIKVLEAFTGNGDDVAAAKRVAETMIKEKADVLIHQANAAAQGVFNAAKDAGIVALGANLDQNSNDSGAVIASATISAKAAYVEVVKLVKSGKFNASVVELGMNKGAIDFVLNSSMKDKVAPGAAEAVEEAKKKLLDGSIVAPKDKF
jgi:basic membrane protein A and related proteins